MQEVLYELNSAVRMINEYELEKMPKLDHANNIIKEQIKEIEKIPLVFPGGTYNEKYSGITLRDWFAGQALMGFMASDTDFSENVTVMAKTAYRLADAMLAVRGGK